jgi:hypothetical protein
MTEIQNSKHLHDFQVQIFKPVWIIGYWNLRFVCNLLARRLSGGVLVCIGFCIKYKEIAIMIPITVILIAFFVRQFPKVVWNPHRLRDGLFFHPF